MIQFISFFKQERGDFLPDKLQNYFIKSSKLTRTVLNVCIDVRRINTFITQDLPTEKQGMFPLSNQHCFYVP